MVNSYNALRCELVTKRNRLSPAKKSLEIESGEPVATPENYLEEPEKQKRKRLGKK